MANEVEVPVVEAPAKPAPTLVEEVAIAAAAAKATPAHRPEEVERALRDEIAALKRESARNAAASEDALSEARLKVAREQAHSKPAEKVGNGMSDVALHNAVQKIGGPCFWERLTDAQKEAALNIQGGGQTKDADIKKIFGPNSDSQAANRLALSNPTEYRRLRKLAQIRKIF